MRLRRMCTLEACTTMSPAHGDAFGDPMPPESRRRGRTHMIGFASGPDFVRHMTGLNHPERPDRIRAIHQALEQAGLIERSAFPDVKIDLGDIQRFARNLTPIDFSPADD